MAFREDADALHARIESLEKELEETRAKVRELEGAAAERDRHAKRIEELERQLGIQRQKARAPRPGAGRGKPLVNGRVAVLGLFGVLAAGLGVAWLVLAVRTGGGGSDEAVANKRPDTRAPSIGVVDLSATPSPAPIPFTVTGGDDAPPGCRGYLPDAPQLVLRTSGAMQLTATTRCNVDLVAVLSGLTTGVLCDDDGGGSLQPRIEATLPAGETRLTIGTYSEGATASCEIELHATPLRDDVDAHGLAHAAEPTIATVALAAGESTHAEGWTGHASATIFTASAIQSGCVGFVSSVPDLVVNVTEPSILRVDASSDTDLVLLLGDPAGAFTCDDDDGMGNSPRIAKRVPPGRYPVWVGTFQQHPDTIDFRVGVRLTTIASDEAREVPSYDVALGTPVVATVDAGDEVSAPSMWGDCAVQGYVPYEPSLRFRVAARGDVTIATGRGDLLLAVTPDGTHTQTVRPCAAEPEWRGTLDAGSYDLWVGVASGETTHGDATVTLSVAPPSVLPYAP